MAAAVTVLAMLASAVWTAGAVASTTTFTPVADSYVSDASPSSNFGTATTLRAGSWPTQISYLRFDVGGFSGAPMTAVLRMYADGSSAAGYGVFAAASTWAETGITFVNAPLPAPTPTGSAEVTGRGYTSVDITPLVSGNGLVSVALKTTSGNTLRFSSREETAAQRPQLVVTGPTADTQAPSVPGGVAAVSISSSQIDLSWSASTDDVGVTGYKIRRDGVVVATVGGSVLSYSDTGLTARTSHSYTVQAVDAAGNASAQSASVSATPQSTAVRIAAAGDIACAPDKAVTSNACHQGATSDLLVAGAYDAVLPLGDIQYYCGSLLAFNQVYEWSWGRVLPLTRPVVGNHEYLTSGAADCTTANAGAAGYFDYFGAQAGTRGQGYYSYDVGSWHLIALNSNCSAVGGCSSTTPQGQWLAQDLAAHSNRCTLAYWHIPLFSSGGRAAANSKSFWTQLYNAGADVILASHDHIYERFAPQDPNGVADPVNGIRQFIAGTGGANHTTITTVAANSEVRDASTFGILELTLDTSSYDWRFRPDTTSGSFTESGSASCH